MSKPAANLLGALKEGYLTKCGDKHKSWKTRWFVLTKDVLYYFEKNTSTDPLGVIPMKDYLRCKGMEGNAYAITRKENSFFLQTPYRTYMAYGSDWRGAENWAESISNLGDFLRKKEDIRNPSSYQEGVLKHTSDIINFGSSIIHWFKLVVDSTPSYKNGVRSIYENAIHDVPRELGASILQLARVALNAVAAPRNPSQFDRLKAQCQKVGMQLDRAVGFISCCAEAHKGKFNQDLSVIRGAIEEVMRLTPTFPVDEISRAAVALSKTCRTLCNPYVNDDDATGAMAGLGLEEATAGQLGPLQKDLSRAIDSNLALLKGKPSLPEEQVYVQLMQACGSKVDLASTALAAALQDIASRRTVDVNKIESLYQDITKNCKEIVSVAQKLFANFSE